MEGIGGGEEVEIWFGMYNEKKIVCFLYTEMKKNKNVKNKSIYI